MNGKLRTINLTLAFAMILCMVASAIPSFTALEKTEKDTFVGILGDVDMDGRVTIKDATRIQKHIAKIISLDAKAQRLARCLQYSGLNIKCVTSIQKHVAKINLKGKDGERIGQRIYSDYDAVFQTISTAMQKYKQYCQENGYPEFSLGWNTVYESPPSLNDYFSTNTYVSDTEKSDIVKTDNKYIYTISDSTLLITEINGEKITKMSKTTLNPVDSFYYSEMYVIGDTLAIIGIDMRGPDYHNEITSITFYDISDRTNPTETHTLSQDGYYTTSKLINDKLFLITSLSMPYSLDYLNENNPSSYVPMLYTDNDETFIKNSDIYISACFSSISYVNISSVDLSDTSGFYSTKSVLGSCSYLYSNDESIYVPTYGRDDGKVRSFTRIVKYAIDGLEIKEPISAEVNGSVLNMRSMDEHNGYFRIITEEYFPEDQFETNLYVLDSQLNLIGKLENLAQNNERVASMLAGDIGYFVPERIKDQMFAVDLSDAQNPIVVNEVEIPKLSWLLHHPFGENLLLDLGYENSLDSDGYLMATDWKLSMFDISDNRNVKEVSKNVFAETYYGDPVVDSEAMYNHKAVYADISTKLVGFMYTESLLVGVINNGIPGGTRTINSHYYTIFKYENSELVEKAKIDLGYDVPSFVARGFHIDEYFYIVYNKTISVYSLADFKEIAKFNFS